MSALAETPSANVAPGSWGQRFAGLGAAQRLKLAIGAAALVALAVAAIVLGRQPDWRVLYANLNDKDGGAVIAQLATMNVPYKYTDGGGAIMVPSDRVHDIRLRLASQGLPKGSVNGFELMENNRFGMTQFQEKVTFQRALEGELTRSIQGVAAVQSARVHLALPNQNGFFREQQKPSASVLVSLYPGRVLDRAQLAGIVHLVASSVPELSPGSVSVVDDSGKLLSGSPDLAGGAVDAQKLQYTQQVEQQYARRILDILEPVVGAGNVKAQVTADVDFSQSEQVTEQHKPNLSPDNSAVRSQQVVETGGAGAGAGGTAAASGVPGATSNQPAAPSAAPINGAAQPLRTASAPAGGAGSGAALAAGGRRESITNYEVDKTVRTVRAESGSIRRISAAVVVNYKKNVDGEGKVTTAALPPEQVEQMTALVRESIGFNKDRGDSVNLMNAPFQTDVVAPVEVPLWKRPELLDAARSFAWPVGLVLMALIVLMGFVRPGLKAWAAALPPPPPPAPIEPQLSALIAEEPPRPALQSPEQVAQDRIEQMHIDDARRLARQNPAAVANIVKNWVHGDAPA
jgi:flagellar M-ring protein FliF